MKHRILSAILIAAILLSMAPAMSFRAEAVSTVPSGYTAIYTPEQLDLIRNDLSGNYILMNDIDLTEALAEGGSLYDSRGWIAIGYGDGGSSEFTGVIDGNGHSITGFKVSGSSGSASFVYQNSGTVKNLTIVGEATQSLKTTYGGIVCTINSGTIQNCHSQVEMNISSKTSSYSDYRYFGVIAGLNEAEAIIEGCSNQATLNCTCEEDIYVGGIAGQNDGTIRACFNNGNISLTTRYEVKLYAGGVVGKTQTGILQNVFNTGDVSAVNSDRYNYWYVYAGGLIGFGDDEVQVENAYNTGLVVADSFTYGYEYWGALCGFGVPVFTDCYYLNNNAYPVNGAYASGAKSMTQNQMKTQAAFVGFDFESIWIMGTYPELRVQCVHARSYVAAVNPTCTEDGHIAYYYCELCDKNFDSLQGGAEISLQETVIAKSHNFTIELNRKHATCVAAGSVTLACNRCGEEKTEVLPVDYDRHANLVDVEAVAPDCTNGGSTACTYCTGCGVYLLEQEILEPLGHAFDYQITAPTLEAEGFLEGTCATCGAYRSAVLPVLNETDYTCTVLQAATYYATGLIRYTWNNTEYGTYDFEVVLDKLTMQSDSLITIGSANAAPGETVELVLSLSDAPALRSLGLSNFVYNTEHMTLISVEWLIEGALLSSWDAEKGKAAMAYASDTDINGDIFKLTFQIHEDAPEGEFTVSCEATGKIKPDGEDITIAVATSAGAVTVRNYIPGDVDGDEIVDTDDAIYLLYYTLFGEADYPIQQPCDFDGDGVVDTDDAIYLLYHTLFGEADYPLN